MLEKNENFFCDAHFHYTDCISENCCNVEEIQNWAGCSCFHSKEEWFKHTNLKNSIIKSYGLHPQSAGYINIKENLDFLESLIEKNEIYSIGETGFDFFTSEYKEHKEKQEQMFNYQLELALNYNLPVVFHCRKANEKIFEYSTQLKKLPAVLFHSFMGPYAEAESILKKGINGYFSFGKQMMNNNKKVLDCCLNLPLDRLLCETDAPFQFLKNETKTYISDICTIYKHLANIRNVDISFLCDQLKSNYIGLYNWK